MLKLYNQNRQQKFPWLSLLTWIKNQLRTSEQSDRFPAGFCEAPLWGIRPLGIPDLGCPSAMDACGNAGNNTRAGSMQKNCSLVVWW
jgi:hypothetical protein